MLQEDDILRHFIAGMKKTDILSFWPWLINLHMLRKLSVSLLIKFNYAHEFSNAHDGPDREIIALTQ